jgi:hypothetical protein
MLCHACGKKDFLEAPAHCAMIGAKPALKNIL